MSGKPATPNGVVPKVGIYMRAEDIARAQERVASEEWAKKIAVPIIERADQWAGLSNEWYEKMLPEQGAVFSYGKAGCPKDNASWPNFGAKVCSFDRPFVISCPEGHDIEFSDPDSPYYDEGEGIVVHGVRHYLRGTWNAFVLHSLIGWGNDSGAVYDLTYAYALTGKSIYAEKAIWLMDALATLQPTTIGPRDFQRSDTSVEGRFHLLTSIVDRTKMHLYGNYDLLYNHPLMQEPSPSQPGMTIAENMETNMIRDYLFAHGFDPRDNKLRTMHNHEADAVRAMLGAGLLLGEPDYIRWGFQELGAILDNTLDRDGMYYETSLSYGNFSRNVFLNMAELAYNYDPKNYDGTGFPAREEFAYNANFYDHPKFQKFVIGFRERVAAGGHTPAFGNYHANRGYLPPVPDEAPQSEWNQVLQFFMRVSDVNLREELGTWLQDYAGGPVETRMNSIFALFRADKPGVAQQNDNEDKPAVASSDLMGPSVLAIMRSEEHSGVAAVMRGGPLLAHSHDDMMGLNLYNNGYEQTADIGYGTFGSPVHFGWGNRSVSHNLVVVNEARNRNDKRAQIGPGASVQVFAKGKTTAYVEMDAADYYEAEDNLSMYRRGLLLVNAGEAGSYWVDIFRVVGGETHDYVFHARSEQDENPVEISGVETKQIPGLWSMAGLSEPDALYNQPGQSWGERILTGENIKPIDKPGDTAAGRGWIPEPGNGYGFIHHVKGARAVTSPWKAVWSEQPGGSATHLTMLVPEGTDVYQGLGPELNGRDQLGYVISRRSAGEGNNLASQFVAVIDTEVAPVVEAERLPVVATGTDLQPFLLRMSVAGGLTDYVFYTGSGDGEVVSEGEVDGYRLKAKGRLAHVRLAGNDLQELSVVEGTQVAAAGWLVFVENPAYRGKVKTVDYENSLVTVDADLPEGAVLQDTYALFDRDGYGRNSAFRLAGVKDSNEGSVLDLGGASLVMASGEVEGAEDGVMQAKSPFPTGWSYAQDTRFLRGKEIRNLNTGEKTTVSGLESFTDVAVSDSGTFQAGDAFAIHEIQIGDDLILPTQVTIEKAQDSFVVSAQAAVLLVPPIDVVGDGLEVSVDGNSWQKLQPENEGGYRLDPVRMGTGTFLIRSGR